MTRYTLDIPANAERVYPKKQIVLYQGEEVSDICLIKSGYVKVYDITSAGDEKLILILGPGDFFPVIWTFKPKNRLRYFYETMTEATITLAKRDDLLTKIQSDHQFSIQILRYFMERIGELYLRVECLDATNAKHKVAQVLDYLVSAHGDGAVKSWTTILVPVIHQDIANMAGISRETVSLQLKELEEKKIVSQSDCLKVSRSKLSKLLA